jgi:hypothetical protein
MARTGARIHAYKVLVGLSEEKRPFGRLRSRWENNITMEFRLRTSGELL